MSAAEMSQELVTFFEDVNLSLDSKKALIDRKWTVEGLLVLSSLSDVYASFCHGGSNGLKEEEAALIWKAINLRRDHSSYVWSLKDIELFDNEKTFFTALFQSPETIEEKQTVVRFCQNNEAFKVPFGLYPKVSGLYIRKCYSDLLNKLLNANTSLQIVTGNSGIGNTFFGLYALRKLIKDKRAVLYEPNMPGLKDKPYEIYKIMPNDADNGVSIKKYNLNDFFKNRKNENIDKSNFIHIVDGHEPLQFATTVPIILITSNRRMNLEEFEKGDFEQWFMPLWSLEELLEYRESFCPNVSEELVNRLFEHWDGLIRYVITKPVQYMPFQLNDDEIVARVDKYFDLAIEKSNITTLKDYIYERDSVLNDVEISNKIILLNINTSTFQIQGTYMTHHARKQVIAQVKELYQEELFKWLDSLLIIKDASETVIARSSCMFEDLGESILAAGGTYLARKMVEKGQPVSSLIKISFPKHEIKNENYTSYSRLQDKAKQAAQKANATKCSSICNNNSQAKDIVSTIKSFQQYTNMLFRINHDFPTIDCDCCYLNENISDNEAIEEGPCTFQLTVGANHSNNMTWDSYNLFDSLYSSSNGRKIKHFIVVICSNFENFFYKNSFETSDPILIEYLFNETISNIEKVNADKDISDAQKVISEAEKAIPYDKENAIQIIFEAKRRIANKALSEKLEQRIDQYCLKL